jgi:1-acyl-sn-glycerol-3-phosphate acyltransferase
MTSVFGTRTTIANLFPCARARIEILAAALARPSLVYVLIAVLTWPFVRGLFRLRARGTENLPREGGYVLAANHLSNFDPWPLGIPLFPRRHLRFMAKSELYWWPLRWVLDAGGAFPVRRGERDAEAIAAAVRLARDGQVVVMFPEGTRRRKGVRKKWQARPHIGAARIAADAGVPLVPAAISGTDRLARLGPLRVTYGPPVEQSDDPSETTKRLMDAISRLEETR